MHSVLRTRQVFLSKNLIHRISSGVFIFNLLLLNRNASLCDTNKENTNKDNNAKGNDWHTKFLSSIGMSSANTANSNSNNNDANIETKDLNYSKWNIVKYVEETFPNIGESSICLIMGLGSGFVVKRIGKLTLTVISSVVITIKILQHYKYIDINYSKLTKDIENTVKESKELLDIPMTNTNESWDKLNKMIIYNIPFPNYFASGFIIGMIIG